MFLHSIFLIAKMDDTHRWWLCTVVATCMQYVGLVHYTIHVHVEALIVDT